MCPVVEGSFHVQCEDDPYGVTCGRDIDSHLQLNAHTLRIQVWLKVEYSVMREFD